MTTQVPQTTTESNKNARSPPGSPTEGSTASKKMKTGNANKDYSLRLPEIDNGPLVSQNQQQAPETDDESRHRCPHHPTGVVNKGDHACVLSEYANTYRQHPIDIRKPIKPEAQAFTSNEPIQDATTHRVDYIKHPLGKPFVHQHDRYRTPDGDFDHQTSYKKEYNPKPIDKTPSSKKDYVKKSPGKFEGEPTYKNDYRKWALSRTKPIRQDAGYRPTSQPFEGNPTYTTDYIKHDAAMRTSLRPTQNALQSDQPFDSTTGYKTEYIKHRLPTKEVREKPQYKASTVPMDDLSNYKKDYIRKDISKNPSCKPENNAFQSDAPFAGETTNKADFLRWKAERPYHHEPDRYAKPDGDVDYNTTNKTSYDKKPIERVAGMKPNSRRNNPGKFNDDTNYKSDFRKWSLTDRAKPMQKDATYSFPDVPFEGLSNYTSDYIGHKEGVRASMRPVETQRGSDQPFDGQTGYRTEFIKHRLPEKFVKDRQPYKASSAPFDDLSNYKKDYVDKGTQPNPSCKPVRDAFISDAPLDSDTTNRVDFKAWKTERPHHHEPDRYVKPEGCVDYNTTHNTDYNKKPIERVIGGPPTSRRNNPGKFDDSTNYKSDFKKWGMGGRAKPIDRGDAYCPPDVPFKGSSNYQDDYLKYNEPPRQSMRPANGGNVSDAPFEGNTMYRTEFVNKRVPPCPAGVIQGGGSHSYKFLDQTPSGHLFYEPGTIGSITKLPQEATNGPQLAPLSVA